jgi:hypothetical protein
MARRIARVGIAAGVIIALAVETRASSGGAQMSTGTVTGIVVDDTGAPVAGAAVILTTAAGSRIDLATGGDGRYSVTNVPAGHFQVTVGAHGFAEQTVSASVAGGDATHLREIRLRVVNAVSIDVTPSVVEIAEQQITEQESQRVFGVVPNFLITFNPDAAPLNARQKFQLSWKTRADPMQFAFVAMIAGVQQHRNDYSGFGDGVSGYAKRYAAAYATAWTSSLMTRVVMPTLFRQDPRYFFKGSGSTRSRIAYAVSRSVVRKGDDGRWQPNYSGLLGTLASGAISNLYYPEADRRGARLMLTNAVLGIGGSAAGHIAQEFLYARFTTRGHQKSAK